MKFLVFFTLQLGVCSGFALKPLAYVADKVASQNVGGGILQIQSDLRFADGSVVRENLYVRSRSEMLYDAAASIADQKYRWGGNVTVKPIESELFIRDGKTLLHDWISQGFAAADALEKHVKETSPHEELVKLVRFDGSPHYQLGLRPAEEIPAKAVWIEQDEWRIKKIKISSDQEADFLKYMQITDTTSYPQEVIYRMNGQEVHARILAVRKVSKIPTVKRLSPSDLLPAPIKQFYLRFR